MNTEEIKEKIIYGISTRTTNANEMSPETSKIGKTWKKFDEEAEVDYQGGERVYGVYSNYESDANGAFDVLAGYERTKGFSDKVIIHKGTYLRFESKAKTADDKGRIQAVIESWGKVWKYFSDENSEYKRAYITDFEYYKDPTNIVIYISIL